MNPGAQCFVRCIGGNFLRAKYLYHLRPKTNVKLRFTTFHRSLLNIQPLLTEQRQCSSNSTLATFSSSSSSTTNSENLAHSTTTTTEPSGDETVTTVPLTFIEADGTERLVQAELGRHLLDVAHDNHVELEGACGGELSCSTCHLIFEPHVYETLTPKLDDEQDMLDLAFGVTETYVEALLKYNCIPYFLLLDPAHLTNTFIAFLQIETWMSNPSDKRIGGYQSTNPR